jgi:alanine-glyoxylate transaminase/serine-glyoxylate transaminase/serine-pyruvate transaminase
LHVPPDYRLKTLTTVRIPEGIDDARIRQRLLSDYGIEISGGLGTLKGKVWRIGLMGYTSTEQNVLLILSALEKLLAEEGYKTETGAGIKAAVQSLRK